MKSRIRNIDFSEVDIQDPFWKGMIELVRSATIPACLARCRETGRIDNFRIASGAMEGVHSGRSYDDSDVYKLLEGIGYLLSRRADAELEKEADGIIACIVGAQEKSGYLNTKHSISGEGRFVDMDEHEMYNGGHLLEAGIAYFLGTGKDALLRTGMRFVDHMMELFGPEGRNWVPGHQEIELALVKLGELVGKKKYVNFARWLLGQRGRGYGSRGRAGAATDSVVATNSVAENSGWDREYYQDLVPAENLERIHGHAVRAMYMFSAMADVSRHGFRGYRPALESLWRDIAGRHMYITGGIGASRTNEGFDRPFELPNDSAYCETCASAGMAFFNHRMFLLTGESKYLDLVERELYNGAISGLGRDGLSFFYDNPLESAGKAARKPWFRTSCCPTQLARFVPSIGNYVYATKGRDLYVATFVASELERGFRIRMEGDFPESGRIRLSGEPAGELDRVLVRIPGWANSHSVGGTAGAEWAGTENGFLAFRILDRFEISIEFDMKIDFIRANERVACDRGLVAVQRGPVVYCLEEIDAPDYAGFRLGEGDAYAIDRNDLAFPGRSLIRVIDPRKGARRATLIPYHLWNNRGACGMRVFLPSSLDESLYHR
jgi:hypothetical protein